MNELDKEILKASLEYLFWFSRFEYTLKQNKFLRNKKVEDRAAPDWHAFIDYYYKQYVLTKYSKELIKLAPKQEVIKNKSLELKWTKVKKCSDKEPLCTVINLLKTVRNNLFHGGKHSSENNIQKKRNLKLIQISILVIQEIADIDNFGGETFKPYEDFDFKEEIFKVF